MIVFMSAAITDTISDSPEINEKVWLRGLMGELLDRAAKVRSRYSVTSDLFGRQFISPKPACSLRLSYIQAPHIEAPYLEIIEIEPNATYTVSYTYPKSIGGVNVYDLCDIQSLPSHGMEPYICDTIQFRVTNNGVSLEFSDEDGDMVQLNPTEGIIDALKTTMMKNVVIFPAPQTEPRHMMPN
jgi:hypothetical protein